MKYIFHKETDCIFCYLKLVYKPKVKDAKKTNLSMGSIEISHIEQIYCFLDMLSMRMTDLLLTFLCEFGQAAPKVTYCSFNNQGHNFGT
jgi:hypothetical protein